MFPKLTRASERNHSWAARLTPRWPQFPVLPFWPQLSLHMCMTFYNCKRKKEEIRSSWSRFEHWLRITRLDYMKLYLVIICPNSHEKLTKSEIRSSWSWFEQCSESLVLPIESHVWSLFTPINMKSWPNVKLCKVGIILNRSKSLVWKV